ncbi:MAG: diacylglycerol/lipid kinase family protein [Bacillota bacterium]
MYHFIVNPTAGKGRSLSIAKELRKVLDTRRVDYDMVMTKEAGHGVELARQAVSEGAQVVVSVGGDGTMNEVLQGVAGSEAALALIPTGTGNDLARTYSISLDWQQALEQLLSAESYPMDLGQDRDGYFAILVGVGFPADVMYHVNTMPTIFRGSMAIAAGIVKTLSLLKPREMQITVDDQQWCCPVAGAFVLNTPFTGGGLRITPEAQPDDGWLDICLMTDMSRFELMRLLPKVYHGGHVGHPKVHMVRGKHVRVEVEGRLPKVFDGNVSGCAPIDAQILPGALRIMLPKRG